MRLINIYIIVALLMFPIVISETTYYDDDNLGLVTVETPDTPLQRLISGLTNAFSITPTLKTPKVGESNTIKIVTEVPCKDATGKILQDSDVSSAKFVVTDPDSKTSTIDIKSKVLGNGVCKSETIDFTVVPNKIGKYYVHYIVMQSVYPQILVKEVNDFTVSSGSPQCQKEELTGWKTSSFTTENGKISEQSHYVYDANCNLDRSRSSTSYKTQCDSGYLIEGSSQSLSAGIKQCELEQVEEPLPSNEGGLSTLPVDSGLPSSQSSIPSCTEDISQQCDDGSSYVAYTCSSGELTPTTHQCPSGKDEGSFGEVSLYERIFSLEFYGYATYGLLALVLVGTILVLSVSPKKKRRKR